MQRRPPVLLRLVGNGSVPPMRYLLRDAEQRLDRFGRHCSEQMRHPRGRRTQLGRNCMQPRAMPRRGDCSRTRRARGHFYAFLGGRSRQSRGAQGHFDSGRAQSMRRAPKKGPPSDRGGIPVTRQPDWATEGAPPADPSASVPAPLHGSATPRVRCCRLDEGQLGSSGVQPRRKPQVKPPHRPHGTARCPDALQSAALPRPPPRPRFEHLCGIKAAVSCSQLLHSR